MKDFEITEKNYLYLLRYFDGDIKSLNIDDLKNLKKGIFKGKPVNKIDNESYKLFKFIITVRSKDPKKYAKMKWIYPEWSKEEKLKKLKENFPEDYESEEESEEELPSVPVGLNPGSPPPSDEIDSDLRKFAYAPLDDEIEVTNIESVKKSVLPQRKAFIDWINTFYENQLKSHPQDREDEIKQTKIYQFFVKQYLSIETPFRGLLVYHGLGTGKTATSVVTSEGLSKDMKIYTILPASLEENYINEVKDWGNKLFKISENNWIFYSEKEIKDDLKLRRMLSNTYGIEEKLITKIFNKTKNKLKNNIEDSPDYEERVKSIMRKINSIKGIFLQSQSIKDENREIYTVTGEPVLKEGEEFNGTCEKLTIEQKMFIEEEINLLIQLKYNFIHWNGFPEVHKINYDNPKFKKNPSPGQKLGQDLVEKYIYNRDNYSILSPFRENVVIIDEVHNFVNQIMNESDAATVFYNWIVNSEDVKLIFLSGTPVINKPAEIAILYNMLRGIIHIFDFTIKSTRDELDVQTDLRKEFYKENSSIEQLHVKKKKGKLIVSFTKNKTNFESILENDKVKTIKYNDHTLEEFLNEIYEGLSKIFESKDITPSREDLNGLSNFDKLKSGKSIIFDDETGIIFNRKQKLFDIYDDDKLIDLSNNENFMEYFFDDTFNIPSKKQVLLRRMLLGLTSYYPIDRSSIVNMPEVVEPKILPLYSDYSIVKSINIIPCYMSSIQWSSYEYEYTKEKMKRIQQIRRGNMYNDKENETFNIRIRQSCNIVYEDDTFKADNNEEIKNQVYENMIKNDHFSIKGNLKLFSPKFYEIMKNIQNFLDQEGTPTGKILYYSDFRHESGSEVFEKILNANGYERYDSDKKNINELIKSNNKKKRYTFITGNETQEERKFNKDAFNHNENIYGEYIQIILISKSGAEGISLKCVRQVHIMEPFWNYIRVDQVLGRAIRMESHNELPEDQRNVEQYLYLSMLPDGNSPEEIFSSMKELQWNEVEKIEYSSNIKNELFKEHKTVYKTIQKIISIKKETKGRSIDQVLFDIMEKKHLISNKITNIIKESSVDCIQNTRDDIQLNEKCLRFSSKVLDEEAHFPGINSSELNEIDQKQFKSTFMYKIDPDIYVILAIKDQKDTYIYYQLPNVTSNIDVRYIRENGILLAEYNPIYKVFNIYEGKEHSLDELLGNKLSVFQSIYNAPEIIIKNKIEKELFPSLDEIKTDENLKGLIIKYNPSEVLFYSPKRTSNIIWLYEYQRYKENYFSTDMIKPLFLRNKKVYISN